MLGTCNAYSTLHVSTLQTGVYVVQTDGQTHNVYCDMSIDNGGWTLVSTMVLNHSIVTNKKSTDLASGKCVQLDYNLCKNKQHYDTCICLHVASLCHLISKHHHVPCLDFR